MTYQKPEVVRLVSSIEAIQFQLSKISGTVPDGNTGQSGYPNPLTATAYEADE